MEMREENADFVRSFAISQFDKQHSFEEDHQQKAMKNKGSIVPHVQLAKVNSPRKNHILYTCIG